MSQLITVPDASFAGFYYPEILKELLSIFRRNRDKLGLTDENEYELHVQILRAFAMVGHLNNCRLDMVAQELMIDSAQLLESVRRLLKLIGVRLNSASPAVVDVLARLSEITTSDSTGFISEFAEFATSSNPPITYEFLESGGMDLARTDRLTHVYGLEKVKSGICNVSDTAPDTINRVSGNVFALADIGNSLFIPLGIGTNGGEFSISQFIDADHVRVLRTSENEDPGFRTETGLSWIMKKFTKDYAVENYTPVTTYIPWADPEVDDMLYVGHTQAMCTQYDIDISSASVGITGCWEYFDNEMSKVMPTLVEDNGDGTLTLTVDSLLGTSDRHGSNITVIYMPTESQERLVSFYSSDNKITTYGLLGQVSASVDIEDYLITSEWIPFDGQSDGSEDFTKDGSLTVILPQNDVRKWCDCYVNGDNGWWARYRIIDVSTPTSPTIESIEITGSEQYVLFSVTQGETVGSKVLGSSDGTANQFFTSPDAPFLDDTDMVEIDELGGGTWVVWSREDNLLNSSSISRHYMLDVNSEGSAVITFGDGINGKIPPSGTSNIRMSCRVGCESDGNVGIGEITNNSDGVNGIVDITNPRVATGWRIKDGGTTEDLERIKRDAPSSLRIRNTASTINDIERLAVNNFVDRYSVKSVARAVAVEEGYGPKTVKLLTVGSGGVALTQEQKEDLEEYYNGNRYASPEIYGVLSVNSKVFVVNYEPRLITIIANVVWGGGSSESIKNALLALLSPLSVEQDGVTYVWDLGGWISKSRIYKEIHAVDPNIADIPTLLINGSNASLHLEQNQLPITTASSISVIIQES